MINYLTVEHVYLIHDAAIRTFGGEPGEFPHTRGRIESIVAQQFPVFGIDKYPSVPQKAAMLFYFLTKGHCFVDGNKRVGMQSTIVFLTLNGYGDSLPDGEGYDKTIEAALYAEYRQTKQDMLEWQTVQGNVERLLRQSEKTLENQRSSDIER